MIKPVLFFVVLLMLLTSPARAQDVNNAATPAPVAFVAAVPALELSILPEEEQVQVGSKVAFALVLTNTGRVSLKLLPLNEQSTYCRINGQSWGSRDPSGVPEAILNPGETLRRKFKVSGVDDPGDFKVTCTYGMMVDGKRPVAEKVINIIK